MTICHILNIERATSFEPVSAPLLSGKKDLRSSFNKSRGYFAVEEESESLQRRRDSKNKFSNGKTGKKKNSHPFCGQTVGRELDTNQLPICLDSRSQKFAKKNLDAVRTRYRR